MKVNYEEKYKKLSIKTRTSKQIERTQDEYKTISK